MVAFASDPVTGKGPRDPGGMFPKKLLHGPLSPSSEPVEPEDPVDPVDPVDPEEPVEPVEPVESADWAASREGLFTTWIAGSTDEALIDHVRGEMAGFSFAEWARAMREIGAAYDTYGNPLQHLASLDPPVPAIHLYTQPRHRDYREGQEAFARENPWFRPQLLNAVSHFPTVDEPQEVAAAIFDFV